MGMRAVNILIALFAVFMIVKHGSKALRFVSPNRKSPEPRTANLASFLNVLVALVLLAAAINLITRGFLARLVGW
jgi:hypothetical protein